MPLISLTGKTYPMRSVVKRFTDPRGFEKDTLECGHEVHAKFVGYSARDRNGYDSPPRRRCLKCPNVTFPSDLKTGLSK